ncbi:hypothetical protein EVAR_17136_1 [Eumeta japonica]|uniref:Mos1 transposase HTH domain-containing protein n=1 Tax=Eumeta variegata TaxID=151549 RepID=A0A4C1UNL2_EUMVA|nr:hypothetical protein EVAR_17136_1 [Eumeta japonica]
MRKHLFGIDGSKCTSLRTGGLPAARRDVFVQRIISGAAELAPSKPLTRRRGVRCTFGNHRAKDSNEAPSKTTVCHWFNEFKHGRSTLTDEFKEGRPNSVVVPQNIDAVRELIIQNRYVTYRKIKVSLGISMMGKQTKQQSPVWFQDEPNPKKVIRAETTLKQIVACFFGINGCMVTVQLENRKMVNSEWYTTIYLPEVFEEIRKDNRQCRIILDNLSLVGRNNSKDQIDRKSSILAKILTIGQSGSNKILLRKVAQHALAIYIIATNITLVSVSMMKSIDVVFDRRRRRMSLTQFVSQISATTFELIRPVINSGQGQNNYEISVQRRYARFQYF